MTLATRSSRRLAVILHADVVGSTGLVQQNEAVAHERIRDCFRRLADLVDAYAGRTHEIRGDALVAEFHRASDAVSAALAFQSANASSPIEGGGSPLELRIGIALGEVIVADNTVTGTGVILAQRLEQLAGPGAVAVQSAVYETVPRWLPFVYTSLGEQTVKGFDEPVRAYTIALETGRDVPRLDPLETSRARSERARGGADAGEERAHATPARITRRAVAVAVGVGVVAVGVSVALTPRLRERLFGNGAARIRTIAVLPLANLSGNPDQEYLSDGMTESLINELAKVGALKVISRTSIMNYKGSKEPLREIAQALGADAVLEGAAQRAGDHILISTQLVDARTDRQIWANSYDRNFADVLTLQREVAETVAQQVGAQLTAQEQSRLAPTQAVNTQAHEAYLRGLFYQNRASPADFDRAQQYFELALMHDPNYASAYAGLADVWVYRQQYGLASPQEAGSQAVAAADKAVALDPNLPEAHLALASVNGWTLWKWSDAESEFRRTIELNPSEARARASYSHLLNILGRPNEARAQIERAVELAPKDALVWGFYAVDLYWFGEYDEALAALQRKNVLNPNLTFANQLSWMVPLARGMFQEAVAAFVSAHRDDAIAAAAREGQAAGGYKTAFLRAAQAQAAELGQAKSAASKLDVAVAMDVAQLYVLADRMDLALTWYERAVDGHDPNVPYIRVTMIPAKPPEDDPRFKAILKRIGIP